VLTDTGAGAIADAAARHVTQVRRHLLDLIDSSEAQVMLAVLERVVMHLRLVRGDYR
jgi:hypothetical protein